MLSRYYKSKWSEMKPEREEILFAHHKIINKKPPRQNQDGYKLHEKDTY
ncbi:MAG TPA: hypothetical protein VI548_12175 [Chitinophagaceae bacterium]|nr:hypothetical protein [Chitinophagaceae bacterium]